MCLCAHIVTRAYRRMPGELSWLSAQPLGQACRPAVDRFCATLAARRAGPSDRIEEDSWDQSRCSRRNKDCRLRQSALTADLTERWLICIDAVLMTTHDVHRWIGPAGKQATHAHVRCSRHNLAAAAALPPHRHYLSPRQLCSCWGFVRGVVGHQRILAANLACLDIRGCASSVAPHQRVCRHRLWG